VHGTRDTFSLQYLDWNGELQSRVVSKGPGLGEVGQWVTYTWYVTDAYFNNGMPGGTDFRLSCNNDGDETIHMVLVKGIWAGTPPTPGPSRTPFPTFTPRPTADIKTTPTPLQTPTPGPLPVIQVPSSDMPPVIDGNLEEWQTDPLITLDVNTASSIGGNVSDRSDASLDLWAAWDSTYLYFAARVSDDHLMADSAPNLWHDDSIELGLDGLYDHRAWRADDHQYTICVDGQLLDLGVLQETTNLSFSVRRSAHGYDIEVAIPLANLQRAGAVEAP